MTGNVSVTRNTLAVAHSKAESKNRAWREGQEVSGLWLLAGTFFWGAKIRNLTLRCLCGLSVQSFIFVLLSPKLFKNVVRLTKGLVLLITPLLERWRTVYSCVVVSRFTLSNSLSLFDHIGVGYTAQTDLEPAYEFTPI